MAHGLHATSSISTTAGVVVAGSAPSAILHSLSGHWAAGRDRFLLDGYITVEVLEGAGVGRVEMQAMLMMVLVLMWVRV